MDSDVVLKMIDVGVRMIRMREMDRMVAVRGIIKILKVRKIYVSESTVWILINRKLRGV